MPSADNIKAVEPVVMNSKFQDKRGREWEVFIDESYYHMTCVRCLTVEKARDFNSWLSFHFDTSAKGLAFASLVAVST